MAEPSVFEFSDELGSDPVMRRYRRVGSYESRASEMDLRLALADKEIAKAKFEAAQAELSAQLAPMKQASDAIATMANLQKTRSTLEDEAATRRDAVAMSEELSKVRDISSLTTLGQSYRAGLKDPDMLVRYQDKALGMFSTATVNSADPFEVEQIYSQLDPALASLPEMQNAYNNAKAQAERRFNLSAYYEARGLGPAPTNVAEGQRLMAVEGLREKEAELARTNLKFIQSQMETIQRKMAMDEKDIGIQQTDKNEFNSLREQAKRLLKVVIKRDTGSTAEGGGDEEIVDVGEKDLLPGRDLPKEKPSASEQAAEASAAATGGETPPPPPKNTSTPVPTISPDNPYFEDVVASKVKEGKEERKEKSRSITSANESIQKQIDQLEYDRELISQEIEAINNPLFRASPEEKATRYENKVAQIREIEAKIAQLKGRKVKRARPAR